MAYYTWFTPGRRSCQWGTPSLGNYASDDRNVMRQHAHWLRSAHVDFIVVDWSNDVCCSAQSDWNGRQDLKGLELNTVALFEEFAKVKGAPKIAIMVGSPYDSSVYSSWDLMRIKLDSIVGLILLRDDIKN